MAISNPLVYNVKNYGAVGNGSTDDTAAFMDPTTGVFAACKSTGDQTPIVYIPEGQYRVSQLVVPAGVVMQGVHSSAYGNSINMDQPGWPVSVLEQIAGSNKDMIVCDDGANYQHFYDLGFDGNKNNNTTAGHGLYIKDGVSGQEAQQVVERCFFFNFHDSGIYLGHNRRAVKIINCTSNYSAVGDGITVTNSDSTISGCIFGSNARAGVCLGSTTALHWSSFGNNTSSGVTHVFNNDIYQNLVGVSVGSGSWGNMISLNGCDRHLNDGMTVYSGTDTIITGNTFHSNGTNSNDTYGHIGLGSGVSQVAISDNDFGPQDGGVTNKANYGVYKYAGFAGTVVGDYGVINSTSTVGGLHN